MNIIPSISIIIPCYNEENSIPRLIERCYTISINRKDIQFVFVNNGSTDNTLEILNFETNKLSFINSKVASINLNIGYGNGIKFGLNIADNDILAWTHADLQTDPIDVIKAFDLYKNQLYNTNCIVKGSRKNRPFFDNLFTIGMSIFSSIYLKKVLWDINAQPKIFHKNFLFFLSDGPDDFSLDLYFLYVAALKKYKIYNFPVFFNLRMFDQAKGGGTIKGKIKLIKRTFIYIFSLNNRVVLNKNFN